MADRGRVDTHNNRDNIFSDSLEKQLATVKGNLKDGFTLSGKIIVKA